MAKIEIQKIRRRAERLLEEYWVLRGLVAVAGVILAAVVLIAAIWLVGELFVYPINRYGCHSWAELNPDLLVKYDRFAGGCMVNFRGVWIEKSQIVELLR